MGDGLRDGGLLRRLFIGIERAVAEEAAGSAVRGAAQELHQHLPEADDRLRQILDDTLVALTRIADEAAHGRTVDDRVHDAALAATRGALEELERQWAEGGLPLHGLLQRTNTLLDRLNEFTRSRAEELKRPGERAHSMAANAIRGATGQLHEDLPRIAEDLGALTPLGGDFAYRIGRGLLDGLEAKVKESPAALSPLLHEAGRALVAGLATGVQEELSRRSEARAALESSVAVLARRAAAESVRGAVEALRDTVGPALRSRASTVLGLGGLLAVSVAAWRLRSR